MKTDNFVEIGRVSRTKLSCSFVFSLRFRAIQRSAFVEFHALVENQTRSEAASGPDNLSAARPKQR